MKDLIIIGAGNVGCFLALNQDLFQTNYNIIGFLDDDVNKIGKTFFDFPVLSKISDLNKYDNAAVVIGISNTIAKKSILNRIGRNHEFPNFVSKNAWVSQGVSIGKGIIIYPNVSINHKVQINDFVIVNMNCAIGHDTTIGKGSALAPGVNLGGFTKIGKFVDVGIGAATIQNTKIGDGARIGGQTMILSNVEPYSTYVGVPGRKL